MAVTRGQKSNLGIIDISTSQACTWSVNPTAGSTILVFVQLNTSAANITVQDNGTTPTTFTLDASQVTTGEHSFVYRANNITLPASGSYSVTLTTSAAAQTIAICGIEYLGVKSGAPAATNTGGATGTAVSTGAASSTGVQFGGFSNAFTSTETVTYTGAGTSQFVNTNGTNFWPMGCADNVGSGSMTHTWTTGHSVSWSACIAAYDAATTSTVNPKLVNVINSSAINTACNW
jgi:hypothetical protein